MPSMQGVLSYRTFPAVYRWPTSVEAGRECTVPTGRMRHEFTVSMKIAQLIQAYTRYIVYVVSVPSGFEPDGVSMCTIFGTKMRWASCRHCRAAPPYARARPPVPSFVPPKYLTTSTATPCKAVTKVCIGGRTPRRVQNRASWLNKNAVAT